MKRESIEKANKLIYKVKEIEKELMEIDHLKECPKVDISDGYWHIKMDVIGFLLQALEFRETNLKNQHEELLKQLEEL